MEFVGGFDNTHGRILLAMSAVPLPSMNDVQACSTVLRADMCVIPSNTCCYTEHDPYVPN